MRSGMATSKRVLTPYSRRCRNAGSMGASQNGIDGDRMAALRELELEFRELSAMEGQAILRRDVWLIRLARDLKKNLRDFWQREHPKESI